MSLVNSATNLIFPQRCIVCGRKSRHLLCQGCISKLNTHFNRCLICSRPLYSGNAICINCLKGGNKFNKGFSLFNYKDSTVSKIIELMKFHGYPSLTKLVFHFSKEITNSEIFENTEYLIPVPMHRTDIKRRGFNQSVYIAKNISKITNIKVCFDCISKIKITQQQVGLKASERIKNLKEAFLLTRKINLKKVVIVDDVFTTGSTINEVCSLFQKIGIECNFFTLAATPSYKE